MYREGVGNGQHSVEFTYIGFDGTSASSVLLLPGEKTKVRVVGRVHDDDSECEGCVTQVYISGEGLGSTCLGSSNTGFGFSREFTCVREGGGGGGRSARGVVEKDGAEEKARRRGHSRMREVAPRPPCASACAKEEAQRRMHSRMRGVASPARARVRRRRREEEGPRTCAKKPPPHPSPFFRSLAGTRLQRRPESTQRQQRHL
jgi:hypothetical protein